MISRRKPGSPARRMRGNLRQFARGHEGMCWGNGLGHGGGTTHLFSVCSKPERFATAGTTRRALRSHIEGETR
jgi:hypothetical protein